MIGMAEILLGAIFGGLVFRLIYERSEEIAFWLIRQQCRMMPENERSEVEAEWMSVIHDVEGGAWKLINAVGFIAVAAPAAARQAKAVAASRYAEQRLRVNNKSSEYIQLKFGKSFRLNMDKTRFFSIAVIVSVIYMTVLSIFISVPDPLDHSTLVERFTIYFELRSTVD